MNDFIQHVEIRWADLDPNFHLRHSVYYDLGAFSRLSFLTAKGLTPEVMLHHHIGPILFREECVFKREIRFGDKVTVNVKLDKLRADFSRWTMVHEIFKSTDILAAFITVDGAWLDTQKRKLISPPPAFSDTFELIPKTGSFQMI